METIRDVEGDVLSRLSVVASCGFMHRKEQPTHICIDITTSYIKYLV